MAMSSLLRRTFRPLLWPTLFTGLAIALMIGLGTWQLHRLAWKEGLLAARRAGIASTAIPLAQALADPAAFEYRRVWVEGRFSHDRELYVTSRFYRDQLGFQIVTPLILDDGSAVLVNRGFVPSAAKDPAARPAGQVEGRVRIDGVLRLSSVPGWFTPDNQPKDNLWFYPDARQMAAAAGLTRVPDLFVEAGPSPNPGGLPVGGQTSIDLPNNHLEYAITWYALAAVLLVVYALYCVRHMDSERPA